jgi:hypothetical protein
MPPKPDIRQRAALSYQQFDAFRDGQRFVINAPEEQPPQALTPTSNWPA